jgi:cytochrome c oxidase assembly factor CtaG
VLAHPLVAFPLWAADLYLWHVPFFHEAAVRHDVVHALQHFGFVAFGFNMWMALLGPLPKPAWFGNLARLGYIIAVRLTGALLGNVFVFGGHIFFRVYAAGERAHGISPGADQNAAGAIMMVEGSLLTLALFAWLFARTATEGEERQELLDLAAACGVELSEARAARAVAAGRGAELRRRIESGAHAREEAIP